MNIPEQYELVRQETVKEISAEAFFLRHKKSGAKLLLLCAPDDNKVFSITFRTTPENSTGAPHIMEHSVLCGSEKYPVKDPFIELLKGSLNTFLNAMTWPDKTSYPVASRNDQDFKNLMSVYMDAVFRPNIYRTDKILKQEGHHFELDSPDGELRYNGVVYNEMRGSFSDTDTVLETEMTKRLFAGTTYEHVSGGDPKVIPELSYEEFLEFHRRYYHPSNSYIYLYGDMDFTERLKWLDEAYLCGYDAIDPKTEIADPKPLEEEISAEAVYSVAADDMSDHTVFQYTKAVGGLFDPLRYIAFQVLSYALLNAPGAPIKQALLDAGIGEDIYGGYDSGYRCPVFSIIAKNAKESDRERFLSIVNDTIRKVIREGIPKRTLAAGLHNIEFSLREADYGSMPKGLVYNMAIMETWLHDESKALVHFHYDETFRKLRELSETDWFERLMESAFAENRFGVSLMLRAVPGLAEQEDEELRKKLAAYKATLSDEEIARIVRETAELKEYQEAEEPEEAKRSIPMLALSDVRREPEVFPTEERNIDGARVLYHDVPTNGIGYLDLHFSLKSVDLEDFPYLGILKALYTMMDTERYTYRELSDEISILTGGIGSSASSLECEDGSLYEAFHVTARYLNESQQATLGLISEIFGKTDFSDLTRLSDVLSEVRAMMQEDLVSSGSVTASRRALSYTRLNAYEEELHSGIAFYRFIDAVLQSSDEEKRALVKKLRDVEEKIFDRKNLLVSYTGNKESFEELVALLPAYVRTLRDGTLKAGSRAFSADVKNEYFKTPSMVQYTAIAGNFKNHGGSFTGAHLVFRTIMRFEYLWQNVRVKGGAYGCGLTVARSGDVSIASYRDPNLNETVEIYRGIPDYLNTLTLGERELRQYILGTFSSADMPLQPAALGAAATNMILQGITYEMRQKTRDEMRSCTLSDLRALAEPLRGALCENVVMSVGSEAKAPEPGGLFKCITTLGGN